MLLELRDLGLGPSMDALAFAGEALDADRRVARDHVDADRMVEDHAQHLQQIVCCLRRARFGTNDMCDMRPRQMRDRLLAVLIAETLDHGAAYCLCARIERQE